MTLQKFVLSDFLFIKDTYLNRNDGPTFVDMITDNTSSQSPLAIFCIICYFSYTGVSSEYTSSSDICHGRFGLQVEDW